MTRPVLSVALSLWNYVVQSLQGISSDVVAEIVSFLVLGILPYRTNGFVTLDESDLALVVGGTFRCVVEATEAHERVGNSKIQYQGGYE